MATINSFESDIKTSALDIIGNTPLVAFDRLHPGPGRLLVKCEFMNPGGSVKCRSSLHMIRHAREIGALKPGASVLEISSGNQGIGLAVVCAILGHPLTVVMSTGNSVQRATQIRALGGKCILIPQVEGTYGSITYADMMVVKNEGIRLAEETGAYFINQGSNEMNVDAHYSTTGPEIWRQTGHQVDAFVAAIGTAGTFTGTAKYLKEKNPNVKCFVVEPAGSEPVKGCPVTKPMHLSQGTGYGFIPDLLNHDYVDGTFSVTDEEIVKYKNLIGEKEGLYVGYSSGANVAAAIRLLQSDLLPENAWVITTLNDHGLKYSPDGIIIRAE